jgi:hypothetical protein
MKNHLVPPRLDLKKTQSKIEKKNKTKKLLFASERVHMQELHFKNVFSLTRDYVAIQSLPCLVSGKLSITHWTMNVIYAEITTRALTVQNPAASDHA